MRSDPMSLEQWVRETSEMDEVLARAAKRRGVLAHDPPALAELDAAIARLKAERVEWVRETDALLARRARVAAAVGTIAAERPGRGCASCGGDRGEIAVERVEALLDRVRGGDELAGDRLLAVARKAHVCAGCFDRMLESLDAIAERLA